MADMTEQTMRVLHGIIANAYSPEGRAMFGKPPSGNYASGPLPDYFADRQTTHKIGAGLSGLTSAAALAASGIGFPAAVAMPTAGISALGAKDDYMKSRMAGQAADMWSATGLPQSPGQMAPSGGIDMDLLEQMLQQLRGGR